MRILLAEHSPFYRLMFEAMLQEWGYEVWGCCDGEEAWQLLQRPDAPRLALIDWLMPGVDGMELCRRIRATPALRDTHVVLISVKQDRVSTLLAFESGADDFMLKPFDPHELHARLRVGARRVEMQTGMVTRISDLEAALSDGLQRVASGRTACGGALASNDRPSSPSNDGCDCAPRVSSEPRQQT